MEFEDKLTVRFITLALIFSFSYIHSMAQEDFHWWNTVNQWDGHTPWPDYIIYSPYYMGPNALEVPFSEKGTVHDLAAFELSGVYHHSRGDKTRNLRLELYYPLLKNRIAVEFYGVPVEQYEMDYQTILERRIRYLDGKGTAYGDFYFATVIQLVRNRKLPDVALRMACKTASGTNLGDARYTDAPGYFFDLSFGDDIFFDPEKKKLLRIHAMGGFYSWQMNIPNNPQNDAILYGAGADLDLNSWFINNALEGYIGYYGDQEVVVANPNQPVVFRDRPMLYRVEAGTSADHIKLTLGAQFGLNDFPYNSYSVSVAYLFKSVDL